MRELQEFCAGRLGIIPPWQIVKIDQEPGGIDRSPGKVTIELVVEGRVPCPKCGKSCKRHDTQMREWRDLDMVGWRTVLRAAVPRAHCLEHGIHQIQVPWTEAHSRLTMRLEVELIEELQAMPIRQVAQRRNLSWGQLDRVRSRAVQRGLKRRHSPTPSRIGIDETSYRKGRQYVTVATDLARKSVVSVSPGKGRSAMDPYFKQLGPEQCAQVEVAAMECRAPLLAPRRRMPRPLCASTGFTSAHS